MKFSCTKRAIVFWVCKNDVISISPFWLFKLTGNRVRKSVFELFMVLWLIVKEEEVNLSSFDALSLMTVSGCQATLGIVCGNDEGEGDTEKLEDCGWLPDAALLENEKDEDKDEDEDDEDEDEDEDEDDEDEELGDVRCKNPDGCPFKDKVEPNCGWLPDAVLPRNEKDEDEDEDDEDEELGCVWCPNPDDGCCIFKGEVKANCGWLPDAVLPKNEKDEDEDEDDEDEELGGVWCPNPDDGGRVICIIDSCFELELERLWFGLICDSWYCVKREEEEGESYNPSSSLSEEGKTFMSSFWNLVLCFLLESGCFALCGSKSESESV